MKTAIETLKFPCEIDYIKITNNSYNYTIITAFTIR